ncbi:MAG: serine/threonine protein kinase, partial [Betaproteobacteria bacterium]
MRTYDLGEQNGMYYLTMEFVEGTSLKQLITSRGKLPVAVTLTVGKQLCRALEVAHAEGVIHRDIKPQNIVV